MPSARPRALAAALDAMERHPIRLGIWSVCRASLSGHLGQTGLRLGVGRRTLAAALIDLSRSADS
jgi:hypothetical protein